MIDVVLDNSTGFAAAAAAAANLVEGMKSKPMDLTER